MPEWGWICIGLSVLAAFIVLVAVGMFWSALRRVARESDLVLKEGETVVGKIVFCNPTLYDEKDPNNFEAAFVVFTHDNDASKAHLAMLGEIIDHLQDFEPDEDDAEQEKLAEALETQRTFGSVVRLPRRVAGRAKAYLATPNVHRKMLPEGRLTREYIYVRFLYRDDVKGCEMVDYPAMAKRL